jgi:hypothetical protein
LPDQDKPAARRRRSRRLIELSEWQIVGSPTLIILASAAHLSAYRRVGQFGEHSGGLAAFVAAVAARNEIAKVRTIISLRICSVLLRWMVRCLQTESTRCRRGVAQEK